MFLDSSIERLKQSKLSCDGSIFNTNGVRKGEKSSKKYKKIMKFVKNSLTCCVRVYSQIT